MGVEESEAGVVDLALARLGVPPTERLSYTQGESVLLKQNKRQYVQEIKMCMKLKCNDFTPSF